MNTKKILLWSSLILGEAIIIASFILFRGSMENNFLTLNIIVTTIIYSLFFLDILTPWIDLDEKSQKRVGSLGVRWFAVLMYAFFSIAVMVISNVLPDFSFKIQLILHSGLFFLLLLGLSAAFSSSDKVKAIYNIEQKNRQGIVEMKGAISALKDKMVDCKELPEYFTAQVDSLENEIRYLSPANSEQAFELERSFVKIITSISVAIMDFSLNEQQIREDLRKGKRIFQNRKQTHSN